MMTREQSTRLKIENVLKGLYERLNVTDQETVRHRIESVLIELAHMQEKECTVDEISVVGNVVEIALMYDRGKSKVVQRNDKMYIKGSDTVLSLMVTNDEVKLVVAECDVYCPYRWGTPSDMIQEDYTYRTATNRDIDGVFKSLY